MGIWGFIQLIMSRYRYEFRDEKDNSYVEYARYLEEARSEIEYIYEGKIVGRLRLYETNDPCVV